MAFTERGLDGFGLTLQGTEGIGTQKESELPDELSEMGRFSFHSSEKGQFVLNQGVVGYGGFRHGRILTMDCKDETDWVAVYQASRYAFCRDGHWLEFGLDGEGAPMADLKQSVTLVTGWNPGSRELPLRLNQQANRDLEQSLGKAGLDFSPAWGCSLPEVTPNWRENAFAVNGLTRQEAAELGEAWGQRAVVWLDSQSAELVFCAEKQTVLCGLRFFL